MHCPRLHHFCLWGFLVTSGTHSRLFIHEFGKSCHEHMQITTMNCNWTINHVKKYPFLFEDFILYNFSVIFFFSYISVPIQTNTYCPFSYRPYFISFHDFFFPLLTGSAWFWVCTVVVPDIKRKWNCDIKVQQVNYFWEKRRWGYVLHSPQILFSTPKVVLFWNSSWQP